MKMVDPSSGDVKPVGEQGELCIRAPWVMVGYWGDEENTKETLDQTRWLHTGYGRLLSVSRGGIQRTKVFFGR